MCILYSHEKTKIIIIGAGPAGLTAGLELLRSNQEFEVIILEESGYIGGLSRTARYNDNLMDLGGHRFFSKDKKIVDFWQSLMPLEKKLKPGEKSTSEKQAEVLLLRKRVSRIYYQQKFFPYPISINSQILKNMSIPQLVKIGTSYLKSTFLKKPEVSLENFYVNHFGKSLYETFFKDYTKKIWGKAPSDISPDWGAQRVKGLSLKSIAINLFQSGGKTNGSTFLYPKYGPGQLWETAAEEFKKLGGKIELNSKVISFQQTKDKITSVTIEKNGQKRKINGDIFISSMPLKNLVLGMKNVPTDIQKIASRLPYRELVVIGMLVKKLNLHEEAKSPTDCWLYIQEPNIKMGRIQIYNNWSPYLVKDVKHTVWLGLEYFCNEGDQFWNMTEQESVNFAIQELEKMGMIGKNDVIDAHREQVKKAYPAYFGTYNQLSKIIKYLNQFKNLYCIGRNGQHHYNNMDHSMLTAFEAVDNILYGETDKQKIWRVNTAREYHENIEEIV